MSGGVYVSRSWADASFSSANLTVIESGHLLYDPCVGAVTNGLDCFQNFNRKKDR